MEDPIKTQRKEEMNLLRSYGIDDRTLKDLGLLEADEFDPSLLTIGLPAVADIISGFVSDPEILDVIHHAGVPIHDMTAEMITSVIDGFKAKLQLLHGVEFNPNHSSQDGKFTSGGGGSKVVGASRDQLKRYGKDFGKGKQTQNKDKVVAKFTKDFPEYSSDFAIDQLEKADVLRQRGKIVNDKIMKEFGNAGLNDTIITGRIKESNSVLHKLGVSKEMSDVNDLYDISGVRAMAKDIGGVQEAMDYVRNNYDVISEKNNIDQDRHGYRSYHAIVMKDGIKHEIQIRTVNQETWANWTHDNFYKPATKRLMKFYNTNKEVITSYSVGMSKYFYELDLGLKPTKPDCPPVILQVIGCLG
jgi:ppGpp synthetase/RelA/SpoT-type nucleotidyltranferase